MPCKTTKLIKTHFQVYIPFVSFLLKACTQCNRTITDKQDTITEISHSKFRAGSHRTVHREKSEAKIQLTKETTPNMLQELRLVKSNIEKRSAHWKCAALRSGMAPFPNIVLVQLFLSVDYKHCTHTSNNTNRQTAQFSLLTSRIFFPVYVTKKLKTKTVLKLRVARTIDKLTSEKVKHLTRRFSTTRSKNAATVRPFGYALKKKLCQSGSFLIIDKVFIRHIYHTNTKRT